MHDIDHGYGLYDRLSCNVCSEVMRSCLRHIARGLLVNTIVLKAGSGC